MFKRQAPDPTKFIIDLDKVLEKYNKAKEKKQFVTLTGKNLQF